MTVTFSQAAVAYARTANQAAAGGTDPRPGPTGQSFAELVERTLGDAVGAGRAAEHASIRAVANQADLNDIVIAVTNAEVALETVVAIRDRVIQAYQDIIRMPI